jgi:hypothetical protein
VKRYRLSTALLCILLLSAACGNTAKKADDVAADSDTNAEELAGSKKKKAGAADEGSSDVPSGPVATPIDESAPGASGKTSAGLTKIHGSGKGYTENDINLGFQLVVDTEAGFEAVGAGAVAPDERAIADDMVAWVNTHGGLAGRKVKPIFHTTEVLRGTGASQAEATCATFTEDNKVVAAITSATGGSDALWACTSKKGTPLVERNSWLWDDQYYDAKPDMLYTPPRMSPDRWISHWIAGLKNINFFKGAKLGVARFDGQPFDRMFTSRLKPALAKAGVSITHDAVLTTPPSIAGFGNMNAEISNAIVQMRTKGVTHVIFLQNAGILPFFWMPEADAQKWYPSYGLSTADIPLTLTGLAPQSQLENGVGVSWMPPIDVYLDNDDPARQKREKVCHDILGNNPGFHDGTMCDSVLFLKYALDRATAISPSGLASAVKKMGTAYQSAMTVSSEMNGSKYYDGAAAVRYFGWKDFCEEVDGTRYGCFKFTSGPKAARR